MPLVFGFIGLTVLLCGPPVFFLLVALEVEHLVWPRVEVLGSIIGRVPALP